MKVKAEQVTFIESVDECLAEAKQISEWQPVVIYWEEIIIGSVIYGSFEPNYDTWIDRILIDEKFQGRGLGRKAMSELIDIVAEYYKVDRINLSLVE